jgi:hypothetical protein
MGGEGMRIQLASTCLSRFLLCTLLLVLPSVPVQASDQLDSSSFVRPDPGDAIESEAYNLVRWGLVRGRPNGDLAFGSPITRAELIKVFERSRQLERQPGSRAGCSQFTDMRGHWACGAVDKLAQIATFRLGEPDGRFRPNDLVTQREVLTFISKFAEGGMEPLPGLDWPHNVIAAAYRAGVIHSMTGVEPTAIVSREWAFTRMDRAFKRLRMADGQTVYEQLLDGSSTEGFSWTQSSFASPVPRESPRDRAWRVAEVQVDRSYPLPSVVGCTITHPVTNRILYTKTTINRRAVLMTTTHQAWQERFQSLKGIYRGDCSINLVDGTVGWMSRYFIVKND